MVDTLIIMRNASRHITKECHQSIKEARAREERNRKQLAKGQ